MDVLGKQIKERRHLLKIKQQEQYQSLYIVHQHSINMSWVVILSGNTVVQEILHVQP